MISLPAAVRVYLYTLSCDMRKSFDSLSALAREVVSVDPLSGHLFVYASKRADRLKILYWDRDGWALWAKRLEAGTYAFPFAATVLTPVHVQDGFEVQLADDLPDKASQVFFREPLLQRRSQQQGLIESTGSKSPHLQFG